MINETIQITSQFLNLNLTPSTLHYTLSIPHHVWRQSESFCPCFVLKDGTTLPFLSAGEIRHERYKSGVDEGILSCYKWLKTSWGSGFSFEKKSDSAYTVMPILQGLLIPNMWENEVGKLPFDDQFCSSGTYMPWFGQVEDGNGYIAICETPWDAGYYVDHPAGGSYTHVGANFLPGLGEFSYRRSMRYIFLENCDYNDLCKVYRSYAIETGLLTTLKEKSARNPLVDGLIGSVIVHKGIKKHVSPDSRYFDKENPGNNDQVIPFSPVQPKFSATTVKASRSSISTLMAGEHRAMTTSTRIISQLVPRLAAGRASRSFRTPLRTAAISSVFTTSIAITIWTLPPMTLNSPSIRRMALFSKCLSGQEHGRH